MWRLSELLYPCYFTLFALLRPTRSDTSHAVWNVRISGVTMGQIWALAREGANNSETKTRLRLINTKVSMIKFVK